MGDSFCWLWTDIPNSQFWIKCPCLCLVTQSHKRCKMSLFGFPDEILTDNEPQYMEQALQNLFDTPFCYGVSSPHYSKSNGFIERHVKHIKSIVEKTLKTGSNLQIPLLQVRATPLTVSYHHLQNCCLVGQLHPAAESRTPRQRGASTSPTTENCIHERTPWSYQLQLTPSPLSQTACDCVKQR